MARILVPFGGGSRDPFFTLHREMNRLFDDALRGSSSGESGQGGRLLSPQLDVHEDEGEYCITVDMPGVAESDLDLSLDGDLLTVRGEKKHQSERDERGYHVMERSSGVFQRSLRLPFEPDPERVHAECRDGVLTVHVPKEGQKQRTRKITVKRGEGGQDRGGEARTIEGRSQPANDRQQDDQRQGRDEADLQQAASGAAASQPGGADDIGSNRSGGQSEGEGSQNR